MALVGVRLTDQLGRPRRLNAIGLCEGGFMLALIKAAVVHAAVGSPDHTP